MGDIDSDGDLDFVGNGEWWENVDGMGQVGERVFVATSTDSELADLDGDGDLDMAGVVFFTDRVWWWENLDGLGTEC